MIFRLLSNSFKKNQTKSVSTIYKKWLRYLKNNKLFDEYMIYMYYMYSSENSYPCPRNYEELSKLAHSLQSFGLISVGYSSIHISWYKEFLKFVKETVQWWNFYIKTKFLW